MTSAGTTFLYFMCSPILQQVRLNWFSLWRNGTERKRRVSERIKCLLKAKLNTSTPSFLTHNVSRCKSHSQTRFKRVHDKSHLLKWGNTKWLLKNANSWRIKKFVDWHGSTPINQNGNLASSKYLLQYNVYASTSSVAK